MNNYSISNNLKRTAEKIKELYTKQNNDDVCVDDIENIIFEYMFNTGGSISVNENSAQEKNNCQPIHPVLKRKIGKQPIQQPVEHTVEDVVKRVVEHAVEDVVEQPVEHAVNHVVEQPVKHTVEDVVKHTVEDVVKHVVEQPVKHTVEDVVEQPVEHAVEDVVKHAVEPKKKKIKLTEIVPECSYIYPSNHKTKPNEKCGNTSKNNGLCGIHIKSK
jgi:hypothetical protein